MSSTIRSDRSHVSARPIRSRFTAINPTRFSSRVSSSVSNQCSVEVSAALRFHRFGDPIKRNVGSGISNLPSPNTRILHPREPAVCGCRIADPPAPEPGSVTRPCLESARFHLGSRTPLHSDDVPPADVLRSPDRQPVETGRAQIRRSIDPNSRRVRWLSAVRVPSRAPRRECGRVRLGHWCRFDEVLAALYLGPGWKIT